MFLQLLCPCVASSLRHNIIVNSPLDFVLSFLLLNLSLLVEKFEEIADSLCVGQQTDEDERVVLFLKMASGYR